MIPGITTDYGATPLSCGQTEFTGIERFVGGASNGDVGIAAMRYTNPLTRALKWQKVWFFLEDDVQHTMISNVTSTSGKPVYSVLDQRLRDGLILLDDGERLQSGHSKLAPSSQNTASIWHGSVGYTLSGLGNNDSLHIEIGEKTGEWPAIGTSTQPPTTVDLFAAWVEHSTPLGSITYSTSSEQREPVAVPAAAAPEEPYAAQDATYQQPEAYTEQPVF